MTHLFVFFLLLFSSLAENRFASSIFLERANASRNDRPLEQRKFIGRVVGNADIAEASGSCANQDAHDAIELGDVAAAC